MKEIELKKGLFLKKVLFTLLGCLGIAFLTGGYFIYDRWSQNIEQVIPFPYEFQTQAPTIKPEAPILIVGDRMGTYFAKFQDSLAATISKNLSKPIKIQSIARPHQGIHRTLHELRSLTQWPQIVIYQGGSEEFWENKFELGEIKKIRKNFQLYQDDRLQTLMILYPALSRIIYWPVKRTILGPSPKEQEGPHDYVSRLETELLLYEQHLNQLVNMARDKNALLILTTTPINLDISPRKICPFTSTPEIEKEILIIEELMQKNDYKNAYHTSGEMVKRYSGNAKIFYLHGLIAQKLNYINQAKDYLKQASAFDCDPWRTSEVQNSIIRRVAKNNHALLFDFAKLVENDWNENTTFFDELYAQNLYYEKGMHQLGLVIKEILKL